MNQVRPNLPQQVRDPEAIGSAKVYHSNNFTGARLTGNHWKGDLPPDAAHHYLTTLREALTADGWDLSPNKTKILMLTHNVLAAEQQYKEILDVFDFNDSLLNKEDPHIAFLVDIVEPACAAFSSGKFGEMFSVIGRKQGKLATPLQKSAWMRDMQRLVDLRSTGTIGDCINLLKDTRKPALPDSVLRIEQRLEAASQEEIDESRTLKQIDRLRTIPYQELTAVASFINDHTLFSTKHGVKGAEFDNVIVVLGRGWNQYNWNDFLEWFPNNHPANKKEAYIRNRNLFYVACSRPKTNLALLFTQELTHGALSTLYGWFGIKNVTTLTNET